MNSVQSNTNTNSSTISNELRAEHSLSALDSNDQFWFSYWYS